MNARRQTGFAVVLLLFAAIGARAAGFTWPTNQLLPTFSTPATNLDCIDITSLSAAEADFYASLQGIVNRTQPRIACAANGDGEGKFTWLNLHNLPYTLISGTNAVLKYQTNVNGLVVTDPAQPDTLNLATTIAGVSNLLICDPSLLNTFTNAPYNLPVAQDLRGKFSNKYQIYGYLYTNYWPQCTHRIMTGLWTNLHGQLRDYCVAVKSAVVWLDPGTFNFSDKNALAPFLNDMTPLNGIYIGWWPDEGNGLNWIAQYGIPVLASDYFRNASVFSGVAKNIVVPDIPPPPPLANKVYVSLILSDGDNIQYMQHVMKMDWDKGVRGNIPIGWTASPLAADLDPAMMNHYWNSATSNDCLISGPSGAGYCHIQNWSATYLAGLTKLSNPYLQKTGMRVITIWDQVTTGVAQSFATNCPTLLGLTDQSGGNYTSVNMGLRTIGLTVAYSSSASDILYGITNTARTWNGTAPMFIGAQAVVWNLGPDDLKNIASQLDTNKYVLVRPDHLFMLYNQLAGNPVAITKSPIVTNSTIAALQGSVIPNGLNARAWFDWGTNSNYGSKSSIFALSGVSLQPVSAFIGGLKADIVYHYRTAVSNALGITYGADKAFKVSGRVKVWGDGSLGQTNLPPGLTNAVAVSCGANHGLALKNDGQVVAWGFNTFNQATVPPGLGSTMQIGAGVQHSLALSVNGTVTAWGDNSMNQTNVPAGLSGVTDIAAGGYHSLALKSDGTVVAWGYNNLGQTNVPAGLSNVVAIAGGRYHSLALKADGKVVGWGNTSLNITNPPAGLNQVVGISAGDVHSVALKAPGSPASQLLPAARWVADGTTNTDNVQIGAWPDTVLGRKALQTASGNRPTYRANMMNGHAVMRFFGSQYLTVSAADSPMCSAGSFTAAMVFKTSVAGASSSLFYQNTGLLGCEQPNIVPDWALCLNGSQLGAGLGGGGNGCGTDLSLYGGNVTDNTPHLAIYHRNGGIVTLYVDGIVVATQSALCAGARGTYPFQIGAMVAGSLYFNGDIAEIQLFDRALSAGELTTLNQTLGVTYGIGGATRTIVAWGSNGNGQTNVTTTPTNAMTIASGNTFNFALRPDGSVFGWGNNGSGQLNPVPGLTNVSAISGGTSFALALGNQPPAVSEANLSGYVNHDLSFALPVTSPDQTPLNIRVLSLPAAGQLYQSSGGARGPAISAPNTVVTDPAGQVIFAPAPGDQGSPYANFGFSASDAVYTSSSAQATIGIGLPAAPQFDQSEFNSAAGNFSASFSGSSNATYNVWASTNLSDWTLLGPASETDPGHFDFVDWAASLWPQRFYRVGAP